MATVEINAANRYADGVAGYYVRNPRTHIVVAGPYVNPDLAAEEAQRRDGAWSDDPVHLEVVYRG